MRAFYESLNEKDRRRYAAIEARKLGHGGASYIAGVVGCERRLIATGLAELQDQAALARTRIRQVGAGRKPATETLPQLEETFLAVLAEHTAGSPVDENVKWTNLTHEQIADQLKERSVASAKAWSNSCWLVMVSCGAKRRKNKPWERAKPATSNLKKSRNTKRNT